MNDEQTTQTTSGSLTGSLLPNWNTDHGSFNFGDLLILLFDGILLLYTGWRSFDLLSGTVPEGWEIMAFIGLLALDVGAVIWSYIWIFNSTTDWQDKIAMIFFVVDMSGVALTSITDSLLYGDNEGVVFTMLEPIAMLVIPIIIFANVIAGIVYHFTSDETHARRSKRRMHAKARREEQRQEDEELQLQYAQQSLLRRQSELPRKIALANLKVAQDQIERNAMQTLLGTGDVQRGTDNTWASSTSLPRVDVTALAAKGGAVEATVEEIEKALSQLQLVGADGAALPIGTAIPAGGGIGAGTGNGKGTHAQEESIQSAIDNAKRQYPDADPAAIEEVLRAQMGGLGLGGQVVTNPFMFMPTIEEKRVPMWIFFRTNSPKHLIRTGQDGEKVTLIQGVPSKLKFAGTPPFTYFAGRPDDDQPKNRLKNALVPRYSNKGELESPLFFMKGDEKEPISIVDWKNTAVIPEGNDIWGEDPYANPTEAGANLSA